MENDSAFGNNGQNNEQPNVLDFNDPFNDTRRNFCSSPLIVDTDFQFCIASSPWLRNFGPTYQVSVVLDLLTKELNS